ncbi:MAG: glycoside hydrolase family 32 protein [Propionibacteriaceae bacterium]|nr:glycoside hydrolase family 32 protein [Propionibacteriaceae bacterium]
MTDTEATHPRARIALDPHAPAFHFMAPQGWLNDANGLCQWDGIFHLFYQHNPAAPVHNQIQWGHATSTDLVHWHDEPPALTPSAGPDAEGCWSGVLVNDNGTPTLIYSGHAPSQRRTQACCIATGTPDLHTWTKCSENPVIGGPPDELDVTEFRDHSVWREDGRWHQAVGSGVVGHGGALLHYSSDDLRHWDYEGPLLTAGRMPSGGPFAGTTWECPDIFTLQASDGAQTHVAIFSAWDYGATLYPLYTTGQIVDGRFVPATAPRHLDLGLRHFYAPQSFTSADGRRIQFGWAQEARPGPAILQSGWCGVMSLPRQLALGPDGHLSAAPVREVETLRIGDGEHLTVADGTVRPRTSGDQLDLEASVILSPGGILEVMVRATPGLTEGTAVRLHRTTDGTCQLILDRSRSRRASDLTGYDTTELAGVLPTAAGAPIDLRIVVDHSILEVFASGVPLTARIYPDSPDATGVHIATSGAGTSATLSIWPMSAVGRI